MKYLHFFVADHGVVSRDLLVIWQKQLVRGMTGFVAVTHECPTLSNEPHAGLRMLVPASRISDMRLIDSLEDLAEAERGFGLCWSPTTPNGFVLSAAGG